MADKTPENFHTMRLADKVPARLNLVAGDERPMTSPSPRKFKNPKSLALNLSPTISSFQTSEPSSPSFIKPAPLKAKKKPSLLSLNTGAANGLTLSVEPVGNTGVSNMLQRRSLKHSISSPQILSTPGFGPAGGMSLGERKPALAITRSNLATNTFTINEDALEASTGVQMATRVPGVQVGGDTFDRPHSGEDAKSPSYPEGPILMHEPSVHLYLEPKAEEAMKFDVVINVAREVKNPFKVQEEAKAASSSSQPVDAPPSPVPDTATSIMSYQTAFEVIPSGSLESSPTTPKPSVDQKLPEYIHVPWDHNTDVKDELWDLCQTIESRTKEGKRVLVHCQQGASRSATLIIAYGMYINQDLGPNEAYQLAQSKSRWVNPNMSLLFSLNDFKKVIERKKAEKNNTGTIRKTTVKHRPTLSADGADTPTTPSRGRGNSTPSISARDNALKAINTEDIPEPQSAIDSAITRLGGFDFGFNTTPAPPSNFGFNHSPAPLSNFGFSHSTAHNSGFSFNHSASPPSNIGFNHSPAAPSSLPFRREITMPKREDQEWEALMSPRLTEMTNSPLQNFSRSFGGSEAETPPTPALFSPRVMEFPRSSFFPSPAARQSMALPPDEDPRSPPITGEVPITRSIDDFL
jgi:tyrosine-protein phosphatase